MPATPTHPTIPPPPIPSLKNPKSRRAAARRINIGQSLRKARPRVTLILNISIRFILEWTLF